jgi:dTDP-4-amino-4,6-dideoxygalactose transaminase
MMACDSQTLGLSKNELKKHKKEYDAIIVVSPFGCAVDFQGYDDLADELGKPLIYDLAGAWGIKEHSCNPVTYSLHATKNLSVGEGGLVCYRDADEMEHARKLSNFSTLSDRSLCDEFGDNLKLDELRCSVLLALLDEHSHVIDRITKKIFATEIYNEQLSKFVIEHSFHRHGAPSLCVVFGIDAQKIEEKSHLYRCVMKQYYKLLSSMVGLKHVKKLSISGAFFNTGLALPSDVTHEEIEEVVSAVKSALSV